MTRVKFRLASPRAARRFRGAHARRMRITMARVAAVDNGLRPISTGVKPQSAPSEWSAISNEVGRCQEGFRSFLTCWSFFLSLSGTPMRTRESALRLANLPLSIIVLCSPQVLGSVSRSSFGAAHQPSLRSWWTMMTYANSLPAKGGG
jgi:hypothetical protein